MICVMILKMSKMNKKFVFKIEIRILSNSKKKFIQLKYLFLNRFKLKLKITKKGKSFLRVVMYIICIKNILYWITLNTYFLSFFFFFFLNFVRLGISIQFFYKREQDL